jgi:hypothetical protein
MDINEQISNNVGHCLSTGLKWALREVQLAFDEDDSPFFFYFENSLTITGQGSTYWSMASRTFEGSF